MADKSIIFGAPMVNSLLDGNKRETRRVASFIEQADNGLFHIHNAHAGIAGVLEQDVAREAVDFAPYTIGDRLYVREAWSHTGDGVWEISSARMAGRSGVIYAADAKVPGAKYWPSIHMPREFSRLTLLVTDVRVQRLQDISEADAKSEGVVHNAIPGCEKVPWGILDIPELQSGFSTPKNAFSALWNSLHKKPPKRWEDNPWVVAVSFDVQRGNIDEVL